MNEWVVMSGDGGRLAGWLSLHRTCVGVGVGMNGEITQMAYVGGEDSWVEKNPSDALSIHAA
jgi:hypothetical protein